MTTAAPEVRQSKTKKKDKDEIPSKPEKTDTSDANPFLATYTHKLCARLSWESGLENGPQELEKKLSF